MSRTMQDLTISRPSVRVRNRGDWLILALTLLMLGAAVLGCQKQDIAPDASFPESAGGDVLEQTRLRIIPAEGSATSYGMPLSLANTERFIGYYETESVTPKQQEVVSRALQPLAAPCCDDNPMSTCCCDCNLAKSVWGLSRYLVVEHSYSADQVREAALEWLRFTRGDYYVFEDMVSHGIDPTEYGLVHEDSCYVGKCELPVREHGCGGMGELVS